MSPDSAISQSIWDMKYRLKSPDGTPMDRDLPDSWTRVAWALAQAEAPEQRVRRAQEFAHALPGKSFCRLGATWPAPGRGVTSPCSTAL